MSASGPGSGDRREPRMPAGPYVRVSVKVGGGPRPLALLKALLLLGYRKIRWRARSGGCFVAVDEQRIPAIIVVDVAPLRGGYPMPRLSPARAERMRSVCAAYLQDNLKTRRVRADYLVVPDEHGGADTLRLTQRRGVAWAFAGDRTPMSP